MSSGTTNENPPGDYDGSKHISFFVDRVMRTTAALLVKLKLQLANDRALSVSDRLEAARSADFFFMSALESGLFGEDTKEAL